MKTCQKCGSEFKVLTVINGQTHNLNNRKFCLTCSPFKMHNTKDLNISNQLEKLCRKCSIKHPIGNFYKRPDGRPYAYCKPCSNKQVIDRQKSLKCQVVQYLGGSCIICGYNKYYGALELHHLDPSKKDTTLSLKKTVSFSTMKSEVDKCVLLCSNCHSEVHGKVTTLPS